MFWFWGTCWTSEILERFVSINLKGATEDMGLGEVWFFSFLMENVTFRVLVGEEEHVNWEVTGEEPGKRATKILEEKRVKNMC